MTEEQTLKYLMKEIGVTEEEARLKTRDQDLWILDPAMRFDEHLQGDEGVRRWEEAALIVRNIADIVSNGPGAIEAGPAMTQLIWDAAARAEEALRRARLRAEEEHTR